MREVKDYYNKYQYPLIKNYTNRQKRNHKKLVNKILKVANLNLKDLEGKRVLDAGCGTGDKSILFALNNAKVTSIDLTENQLNQAKKSALSFNILNKIQFKQKDIVNNSLDDLGKFDVVFCTGVLHHTENATQGFSNLASLLKRDGIIIIGLYHRYSRIRYRVIRSLLHNLISKNPEKLAKWFQTSIFAKPLKRAPKNSIYDRYLVPYESYHTLKEVKKWFKNNNIEFISNSKNVDGIEFFKVFKKKSIFFVSGIKK